MLHGVLFDHEDFGPYCRYLSAQGYYCYAFARRGRAGVPPTNAEGVRLGLRSPLLPRALPAIATGRPHRPRQDVVRRVAFRELSEGERQALYGRMVPESGLVLREVAVGVPVDRDKVRCPVLALAGESDGVCPPRVLRAVARHYETKPLIYPGIDHWIMNEAGWEKPAADIAGWLDGLAVDG